MNQKFLIVTSEKYFVCYNFTDISEPMILSSTELFDYESLKKEREKIYLKPISNDDKFVCYADGTGYIFEIASYLTIKMKFVFDYEPLLYEHLLCYNTKEEKSLILFNTKTYEVILKLDIQFNIEDILISPNLNYLLIKEGELKLYKIGNGNFVCTL